MLILQNKWINRYIPFSGFKAVNILGVIFIRKGARVDEDTLNHEKIHSAQIAEVMLASILIAVLIWILTNMWMAGLFVLASYYLWFGIEWIFGLFIYRDSHQAYRNISFEREAYQKESDADYLKYRRWFSFLEFLVK